MPRIQALRVFALDGDRVLTVTSDLVLQHTTLMKNRRGRDELAAPAHAVVLLQVAYRRARIVA